MGKYEKEIFDFGVGDIVRFKNYDDLNPFKVISITPRVIGECKNSELFIKIYDLNIGDEINPIIKIEPLLSDDNYVDFDGDGWDVAFFQKLTREEIEILIECENVRLAEAEKNLVRLKKIESYLM
jgi:signal peptidase I